MATTKIEWTGKTWNPTTGCTKISDGCKHCYAEIMTKRLKAMGQEKYKDGFNFKPYPEALRIPYSWKKPTTIFVNSMSDLFHKDMPLGYLQMIFQVMNDNKHHTFQVLTKRGDLLKKYSPLLTWTKNIWMGVSVENQKVINRIDDLRDTGAYIKFLSLEPLLGPLPDLNLSGLDWAIVGGESGFGARPMEEDWVIDIKNQCQDAGIKFFFKQWGGVNKKKAGRELEGRTWDEMPDKEIILK
jgi:protein gp37